MSKFDERLTKLEQGNGPQGQKVFTALEDGRFLLWNDKANPNYRYALNGVLPPDTPPEEIYTEQQVKALERTHTVIIVEYVENWRGDKAEGKTDV